MNLNKVIWKLSEKFSDVYIIYLNMKNLILNNAEHPEEPELEECNNQGVLRQSKFSFRISCSSLILVISCQECGCFSPERNLGKEKSNLKWNLLKLLVHVKEIKG